MPETLLRFTEHGFYCPIGNFYIDPWNPVERAVITHAHGDHLHYGCGSYLVAEPGKHVARLRVGKDAPIQTLNYGETTHLNGVKVSLHPAGHVLGSAQVRIEYQGEVWVVSGDYKLESDNTCEPFEVVPCHTFITEATFALPIYKWSPPEGVFEQINAWWRGNQAAKKASILYAYALGKAQRLIAGVDASIGPIYTHGAVDRLNSAYAASGVKMPRTVRATQVEKPDWTQALLVAPPSAQGTPWLRRFGTFSDGFASGWMRIRGTRRRRAIDRGFVLSDHADWDGLIQTIAATGAQRIWVTHGYVPILVRWLREQGYEAQGYQTRFKGEEIDVVEPEAEGDSDE